MAPDAMSCRVCYEVFDQVARCPRILKCYHTVCTTCINQQISNGDKWCPFCERDFKAKSADDVPINRTTLDFMAYIGRLEAAYDSLGNRSLTTCRNGSPEINGVETDSSNFQGDEGHLRYCPTKEEREESEDYRDELTCDAKVCGVCCDEFDEVERTPHILKCLHTVCACCLNQMIRNEGKKCPFCRRAFKAPTAGDIPVNRTIIEFMEHINQLETSCLRLSQSPSSSSSSGLSIGEDRDRYSSEDADNRARKSRYQITTDQLLEMSDTVKQLLDDGRLFAVQSLEGGRGRGRGRGGGARVAKISRTFDDKLCLHRLTRDELPRSACFIEHADVMDLVNPFSRLAFLDLVVLGSTLGRLYIRLPDTKGARQFYVLCTGEIGPSYCRSNFLQVWARCRDGERILCGDYEMNNGSGGRSLIHGLDDEDGEMDEYNKPCEAGTITGCWRLGDEVGSQFLIHTTNLPSKQYHPVIGIVEEGLNLVKEAVSYYPDIRNVSIEDCGIVLPS